MGSAIEKVLSAPVRQRGVYVRQEFADIVAIEVVGSAGTTLRRTVLPAELYSEREVEEALAFLESVNPVGGRLRLA